MKDRIWEIDAARGLCILAMVAIHLVYDLTELYSIIHWTYPRWFSLVMDWGGIVFFLISGISAAFSRRSLKRGFLVFSCGMLCTAATTGMYLLGFSPEIIIYFGTLHCLGLCMILWQGLKRLSSPVLAPLGILMAATGLWLRRVSVPFPYFIPLGLVPRVFVSSDFFPLLPWLGFFLLGAVLGRKLYSGAVTRFPQVRTSRPLLRFLCRCGRASLWIYLAHQPILAGLCWLMT